MSETDFGCLFFLLYSRRNISTMKSFIILLFLSITTIACAQVLKKDVIFSTNGDISVYPILHSTMALEWNKHIIYTDPYGGKQVFEDLNKADLILITDIHGDHTNIETLEGLSLFNTTIVTCQAVADKLPNTFTNVVVLNNGDITIWKEIEIEAIPMYNLPEEADSRHPKGRGNGYVITLGGKRIYISGDTEDIPEMRSLKNVDAAFVCMNLPYTMDVEAAASAVLEFKPKIIYPFHYRGERGKFSDIDKFKSIINEGDSSIEVKLLEWYPKKD